MTERVNEVAGTSLGARNAVAGVAAPVNGEGVVGRW